MTKMKFTLVRKLDDADSDKVNKIVDRIKIASQALGWEEVSKFSEAEIIIAIGGDGTMLHAMKMALSNQGEKSIKVFGFNIGKLGFLSEFDPNSVEKVVIDINNGNFSEDKRDVIRENGTAILAMNEFTIVPEKSKHVIRYEFFVDGVSSGSHSANGLIISTPTGSTAYSLSAGGAILQPNTPVFQITPVAAMTLNSKSVIVSNCSEIKVKIKLEKGVKYCLTSDGQEVFAFDESVKEDESFMFDFDVFDRDGNFILTFTKDKSAATLIHSPQWNFFEILHQKLHWNVKI